MPFHIWTPDVYQGAPTPATGFMAAVAKAAGFAGLLRILLSAFPTLADDWRPPSGCSPCYPAGRLGPGRRPDRRQAHAGLLVDQPRRLRPARAAGGDGQGAWPGALFYLLTLHVHGARQLRGGQPSSAARARPATTSRATGAWPPGGPGWRLLFTIFLLAQAGVPFTTGFIAKFYVISAAVEQGQYALAVIAMLAAAIAAFFYLRVTHHHVRSPASSSPGSSAASVVVRACGGGGERSPSRCAPPATGRIVIPVGAGLALAVVRRSSPSGRHRAAPVIGFAEHATLLF